MAFRCAEKELLLPWLPFNNFIAFKSIEVPLYLRMALKGGFHEFIALPQEYGTNGK